MPTVSKQTVNGVNYDIKDAEGRINIKNLHSELSGTDKLLYGERDMSLGTSTGKWIQNGSKHAVFPIKSGDVVDFMARSNANVAYALLKSYNPVAGESGDFSESFPAVVVLVYSSVIDSVTATSDCNYLYVMLKDGSNNNLSPASLKINGVEMVYNIREKVDGISNNTNPLYSGYVQFTTTKTNKDFRFVMKPLTSYLVRVKNYRDGSIRLFPNTDSSEYKQLEPYQNEIVVYNNVNSSQLLSAFNVNGTADKVDIDVFAIGSAAAGTDELPRKYIVAKSARVADYTSITECFLALKDDHSPKIVEIWEGTYDIYQEYQDAGVPVYTGIHPDMDFPDYCVFIPENTHVIGKGNVVIEWMPTKEDNPEITWMQCYAVSPVNVMGSMTLENVTIKCKNGRYCIHNDTIGLAPYAGAVQRFINVKCYKYEGEIDDTTTPGETHVYGTRHCLGYGLSRSQFMYFENCLFSNEDSEGRGFYGHSNIKYNNVDITAIQSGEIVLKDCIIDTAGTHSVYLVNMGTNQRRIRTKFSNCYIKNRVSLISASGIPNSYDVTFLNCGNVSVHVDDANNVYPPTGYLTTITNV